jgi:branched-chain amino acid transport system permease protein
VSPESFTLVVSFSFLAAVVVGGVSTVSGAVLGALFIVLVPEYAGDVDQALAGVIYGALLIAFMIVLPGGGVDLARRVWARVAPGDADEAGRGPFDRGTELFGVPAAGSGGEQRREHARS